MTQEEKAKYIDELAAELSGAGVFYLTDTSELTVDVIDQLRRKCFQSNIRLRVVKNTLLQKAMDRVEGRNYGDLGSVLAGPTSIMFSEVGNLPARIIEDFRKKNSKLLIASKAD